MRFCIRISFFSSYGSIENVVKSFVYDLVSDQATRESNTGPVRHPEVQMPDRCRPSLIAKGQVQSERLWPIYGNGDRRRVQDAVWPNRLRQNIGIDADRLDIIEEVRCVQID